MRTISRSFSLVLFFLLSCQILYVNDHQRSLRQFVKGLFFVRLFLFFASAFINFIFLPLLLLSSSLLLLLLLLFLVVKICISIVIYILLTKIFFFTFRRKTFFSFFFFFEIAAQIWPNFCDNAWPPYCCPKTQTLVKMHAKRYNVIILILYCIKVPTGNQVQSCSWTSFKEQHFFC